MKGFADLQAKFPIFVVRNKTNIAQHIPLKNGTLQAQPQATTKVSSEDLLQAPPFSIFKPISPSMDDYKSAGLLKSNTKSNKSNSSNSDKPSETKNINLSPETNSSKDSNSDTKVSKTTK